MELKRLFSPGKIGTLELKNRLVMGPMGLGYCPPDGILSQRDIDYLEVHAKGGVGMIITEITPIDPLGISALGLPLISDDKHIAGWAQASKAVRAHGTKMIMQIGHGGREAHPMLIGGRQPVAPSPVPSPIVKAIPRELSVAEIQELVEKFGQGARRAREAGLDGIQLHAAHGYLVHAFMSSIWNKRTDAYGGDLLGRMKFPLEIIARIRKEVGTDYPLVVRVTGDERWPGGWQIGELRVICRMLAEAGVDAIEVSGGCYNIIRWVVPTMGTPVALNAPLAAAVKEVVDVPVLVVARIKDPMVAETVLEEGQADFIVMSRALLADPELPNKAREGRLEDIIPCTSCSECLQRVLTGQPVTCMVNPTVGRDREMEIVPAKTSKRVCVVGGGPAGLECARIAAIRGHKVTLYEKNDRIGGQFNLASIPPTKQELTPVIKYYSVQLQKLGVDVKLGEEVTPELLERLKPDVVVIATGATCLVPKIPGVEGAKVVTAHDLLAGKVPLCHVEQEKEVGNRFVILGGGMVGAETADYLGEVGVGEINIVEMLPDIACDMVIWQREFLLERLHHYGVNVVTSARIKEILADGVIYVKDGKEEAIRGMDSIVIAMGAECRNELVDQTKGKVAEIHVIGDASQPRDAVEAIREGAETGRKI